MTGDGLDHIYGLTPVLNALQAKRRPAFKELKVQDRSNSEGGSGSAASSRDMAIGFARVACSLGGAGAVQGLEATTGTPTQPPASPRILWSNSRALKSVQTSSFFFL